MERPALSPPAPPKPSPAQATAARALGRAARSVGRENAFVDLRARDGAMPASVFRPLIAALAGLRVYSIVCMVLAATGAFLDPTTWATGAPIETDLVTPFHGHQNPFGMVFQVFVSLHVITGIGLFVTCLVPLFVKKGGRAHKVYGRVFVALWLLHLVDGLANSGQILMARGFEATRYYDVTGQGFSLYLYIQFAFISSMVIDFLANGLAAVHYKDRAPSRGMRGLMLFLPGTSAIFGVGIAIWGALRLMSDVPPETPNTIPFAVIFVVQVPVYLFLLYRNIRYWAAPRPRGWLQGWAMEHQRNLAFCVQVTLYTGLANIADRHAPALTPFLFGLVDVGFLVWIFTKERSLRRQVAASRMGLGLVNALTGAEGRPTVTEVGAGEEAWLRKLLDEDANGEVEWSDLVALLRAQGVEPTSDEAERLRARLGVRPNGLIDRDAFRHFIATYFAPAASNEDALRLAFRKLDRDGDGRIDADELRGVIMEVAAKGGADARLTPLIALLDEEGTGAIGWPAFRRALERGVESGCEGDPVPLMFKRSTHA